jgi:hypothetical protein
VQLTDILGSMVMMRYMVDSRSAGKGTCCTFLGFTRTEKNLNEFPLVWVGHFYSPCLELRHSGTCNYKLQMFIDSLYILQSISDEITINSMPWTMHSTMEVSIIPPYDSINASIAYIMEVLLKPGSTYTCTCNYVAWSDGHENHRNDVRVLYMYSVGDKTKLVRIKELF